MAEPLKVGDWAYTHSNFNDCTYYTKILTLESTSGNGRGFRVTDSGYYVINNNFYFLWKETVFNKITLGTLLNLPNIEATLNANPDMRNRVKEILEWLSC